MRKTRSQASSHRYAAFGLGIDSEVLLPEMAKSEQPADIRIRLAEVEAPPANHDVQHWSQVVDSAVYLYWEGVGKFLIREGTDVVVDPDPKVPMERLRLFLLGPTMGVLLHQRGLLVLHASAVSINGGAVAFMGGKRWGKSTIAATLHDRGHELAADDLLAVDPTRNEPTIMPGFPQLKLWPDSLNAIGQDPANLRKLHPVLEKREYPVTTRFSSSALALKSIYVLDEGTEPAVEALEAPAALQQLISHWYCARFSYETLQALGTESHFLHSAQIIRQTPVYVLRQPRSLSALPDVARVVETHFQTTDAKPAPPPPKV